MTHIKSLLSRLKQNKVANFAYTDRAYTENDIDGVETYSYVQENNIPKGSAEILQQDETILKQGYRKKNSFLTLMLLNHFLGRASYNLNKLIDNLHKVLVLFTEKLGVENGLATLDENGKIPYAQIPDDIKEFKGDWNAETNTPHLENGNGEFGQWYLCKVSGTVDFGNGEVFVLQNSRVLYNSDEEWEVINASKVRKVNNVEPSNDEYKNIELTNNEIKTKFNESITDVNILEDRKQHSLLDYKKISFFEGANVLDMAHWDTENVDFRNNLFIAYTLDNVFHIASSKDRGINWNDVSFDTDIAMSTCKFTLIKEINTLFALINNTLFIATSDTTFEKINISKDVEDFIYEKETGYLYIKCLLGSATYPTFAYTDDFSLNWHKDNIQEKAMPIADCVMKECYSRNVTRVQTFPKTFSDQARVISYLLINFLKLNTLTPMCTLVNTSFTNAPCTWISTDGIIFLLISPYRAVYSNVKANGEKGASTLSPITSDAYDFAYQIKNDIKSYNGTLLMTCKGRLAGSSSAVNYISKDNGITWQLLNGADYPILNKVQILNGVWFASETFGNGSFISMDGLTFLKSYKLSGALGNNFYHHKGHYYCTYTDNSYAYTRLVEITKFPKTQPIPPENDIYDENDVEIQNINIEGVLFHQLVQGAVTKCYFHDGLGLITLTVADGQSSATKHVCICDSLQYI